MANFSFCKLSLNDAYAITNFYHDDKRGSFIKSFEKDIYASSGIMLSINETFVSVSQKNVLRGLHFQLRDPQAKLICLLSGSAWDVIVDLRKNSLTYKKWTSIELSSDGRNAVYVPRGFAHGFVSLADNTIMLYQCEGKYDKDTDTGILFNDKTIDIEWPINAEDAILSDRDLKLMDFDSFEKKAEKYGFYKCYNR